jgi:hypothetical protein
MLQNIGIGMALWERSFERKVLYKFLRKMVISKTAQVSNIVCLGHGSLDKNYASILQHVAAVFIAQDLTALYEEYGKPPEDPITITAQDPAYTENDHTVLSLFPIPIRIVSDPEGFLAINESSLVMSCYPTVPTKQMVADLAADSVSGKGTAALLWNDCSWDEKHGDTDTVTYRWTEVVYFANPGSRRLVNMLDGYDKVMGGAEAFANRFNTEQQEDGHEDGVSELAQTTNGLSAQYDSADGILQATDDIGHEQDDTASVENRVELNNKLEGHEEGEEDEEDEKDEDITKGVPGFKWLKDMEIWARRQVATSY